MIRGSAWIFLLVVLTAATAAHAHQVGLSRGEYVVRGHELDAEIVWSANDPAANDPRLTLLADGAPCAISKKITEPTEGDGIRFRAHFSCDSAPSVLRLDFLRGDATHLARVTGDARSEAAFDGSNREIRLRETGNATLVWMGVRHILSGWDHLLFLLGLVVVGGRWKSILVAVTAFTVAHSITLGLAALDVVRASPIFVEPAIALSVLYVGLENFYVSSTDGRWRITLPFGLIHGFAFAGALRALELPRLRVPMALFTFNAGVEIGQLAVLALVLPVLWVLRKSVLFKKWGVRGISVVIAAAGAMWFVLRVAC